MEEIVKRKRNQFQVARERKAIQGINEMNNFYVTFERSSRNGNQRID